MSYRVFARKYRPQRFQEVVGQRSIIQTLENAISSQKLAQAYLFVGPRGVGKTSIARIFAKALNCHQGVSIHPCGHCPACLEIAEGHSMDVLEIDGASNNSVESIRTLRENAAFAPTRGPYKIYLIDEVHMLTTAAFNALLKTLEEPPEHVKFIFATTEAQKLPATITSRCQRFDLSRLTEKEISDHLLLIAQKEEITLLPEAAMAVAHGADGALRDAESMLDQLVVFCGKTISETDVHHIFGFTPNDLIHQLGKAILTLDIHAALTCIQEQSDAGKDLSRLLSDLIHFFRDLLIETVQPSAEHTRFSIFRNHVTSEKLLNLLEELGKAEERFRWATNKKLQLDVLAIKAIHLLQEVSLTEVLHVLTELRQGKELPLTRIFHADRDEEAAKPGGASQNVSLTQHPSLFPDSAVDQYKISGLNPRKLLHEVGSVRMEQKTKNTPQNLSPASLLPVVTATPPPQQSPSPATKTPSREAAVVPVGLETGAVDIGLVSKISTDAQGEGVCDTKLSSSLNAQTPEVDKEALQETSPGAIPSCTSAVKFGQNSIPTTPLPPDPWDAIATSLACESPLKFGWLTTGRFVERKNHQMLVEFPASYAAQTETLFWLQARKKIQERLADNLGENIELVTHFTGEEVAEESFHEEIMEFVPSEEMPTKNPPQPTKIKPSPTPKANTTPVLTSKELEHFQNDPLIKKALEIFEAEIVG